MATTPQPPPPRPLTHTGNGQFAPGIDYGDRGRYACSHNVLLAHAAAVKLYREKYRAAQVPGPGGGQCL